MAGRVEAKTIFLGNVGLVIQLNSLYEKDLKIVIESNKLRVGKTSIVHRLVLNKFSVEVGTTVGASFWSKQLTAYNTQISLQVC